MQNFKLNKTDLLGAQDWTFPTFTAYGPGRFKEIGNFCKNFNIQNVLIVTDSIITVTPHAKAVNIEKIEKKLNISLVGLKINTTPINPIIIADHL